MWAKSYSGWGKEEGAAKIDSQLEEVAILWGARQWERAWLEGEPMFSIKHAAFESQT